MENKLQIFRNSEFGEVRVVEINNEPWFVAKELGFKSATALNKDLCNKGIQYKINGSHVLYSDYADLGYISLKQQILDNGKVVYNRHFTQDGRKFLLELYNLESKVN